MCKCQKSCKLVYYACASLLIKSVSSLIIELHRVGCVTFCATFESFLFLELAQSGYQDTPVCCHLDFNCLELKHEVINLGVWMNATYLY